MQTVSFSFLFFSFFALVEAYEGLQAMSLTEDYLIYFLPTNDPIKWELELLVVEALLIFIQFFIILFLLFFNLMLLFPFLLQYAFISCDAILCFFPLAVRGIFFVAAGFFFFFWVKFWSTVSVS